MGASQTCRKIGLLLSGGVRNVPYIVDSLDLLRKEEKENPLFSVKKKKKKRLRKLHTSMHTLGLSTAYFLIP